MHISKRVLLVALIPLFACGCSPDSTEAMAWKVHTNDVIRFELPGNWEAVPDRSALVFSPDVDRYEKHYIEIRASRNPRTDTGKVRSTWRGMREAIDREGRLLLSNDSVLKDFKLFELVKYAPAPSVELIPAQHQVAGDRTDHQVLMINEQKVHVTARLLVEDAEYEAYLLVYRRMLDSIRPLAPNAS